MSQLGGAERQVSATGTHVAWAGDSKSVLIRDREGNAGPFGIHQVFLDTLERRRLTQAPVGAGDWRFEVSPDGTTLAFIRYEKVGNRGPVRRPHARRRTAAAVELERNPLRAFVDARMVGRLSTPSTSRQPVVCGESTRTPPHPVEDRPLPTSPRPLCIRRSRGRRPGNRHALRFKRSLATSTFT